LDSHIAILSSIPPSRPFTMSSIQRSKSTPHVQNVLSSASLPRAFSHSTLTKHFTPTRWAPTQHSSHLSPSRVDEEPEDPFNLSGFFPVYPRQTNREASWAWLRLKPDESEPSLSSDEDEEDVAVHELEDGVEETLRKEDKYGVLRLNTRWEKPERGVADDRLLSPYAEEAPVDDHSLYLNLCGLRAKDALNGSDSTAGNAKVVEERSLFFQDDIQIRNLYKIF
jgi:hypothetical protein